MTYFKLRDLSVEFGTNRWQFLAMRGNCLERDRSFHHKSRNGDVVHQWNFEGLHLLLVIRGKQLELQP